MQKQFLLAIVLSFLVIYGWQALFPPKRPQPAQPSQQGGPQQVTSKPSGTAAPGAQEAAAVEALRPATVEAAPVVAAAAEQDVVVENSAVRAVFGTRGAVLKSWRLRN
jgi:YidC/Oxa1 family membrane protein insertase